MRASSPGPRPALLRRFATDRAGVAAVEFALIAPVMLLLYLGGTEATRLVSVDRKVSLAARVAADLVARDTATSISEAALRTVCKGTLAMLAPYPTGSLGVTITAVKTDEEGRSTVDWSRRFTDGDCGASSPGAAKGTDLTPPAGITTPDASLIWAQVDYRYSTLFETVFHAAVIPLSEDAYMRPRTVNRPGFSS